MGSSHSFSAMPRTDALAYVLSALRVGAQSPAQLAEHAPGHVSSVAVAGAVRTLLATGILQPNREDASLSPADVPVKLPDAAVPYIGVVVDGATRTMSLEMRSVRGPVLARATNPLNSNWTTTDFTWHLVELVRWGRQHAAEPAHRSRPIGLAVELRYSGKPPHYFPLGPRQQSRFATGLPQQLGVFTVVAPAGPDAAAAHSSLALLALGRAAEHRPIAVPRGTVPDVVHLTGTPRANPASDAGWAASRGDKQVLRSA